MILPADIQINESKGRTNLINPSPDAFYPSTAPGSSDPTCDEWPMFRGQLNHTGEARTLLLCNSSFFWSYHTKGLITFSLAVAGGCVYISERFDYFYCLNASTGGLLWTFFCENRGLTSSPAVTDGRVFIGCTSHVHCLNATTGSRLWDRYFGYSLTSSPAVADGRVYIGSDGNYIYCLNASSGSLLWSYYTGANVKSSPAVADGRVYIGSYNNKIYCLNSVTGSCLWTYTTGDSVTSSPAVTGGRVYVGSQDSKVYCLNAITGKHLWNYTTGSNIDFSSPAVANGRVYIGSDDNNIYCLNASSGSLLWSYTTGANVWSSPAVAGGRVYIGSFDKNIYCLNAITGSCLWTYTTGSAVDSSPSVAGGHVFVGSSDRNIYCLPSVHGNQTVPSIPQNLQAIGADEQATLSWQEPSSNGSSSIINYKIFRGSSSGNETYLTTVGNILTYTDTGLINGEIYYYKVSAVNGVGEGLCSNEASAIPPILPTAPRNLQVFPYNCSVILTWQVPTFDGGSVITNYKIYRGNTSGNETYLTTVGNILTYTDTGLINDTTYYYKVSAVNGVGEGPFSNEASSIHINSPFLLWNRTWGGGGYQVQIGFDRWFKQSILYGVLTGGVRAAVDSNSSIYCVGTKTNGSVDYLSLTKFYSNGTKAWENSNSIVGAGNGVAVDKNGSIYCAGRDNEWKFKLVKFFSNGTKAWETTYASYYPWSEFLGVAVDNQGSIYCVGYQYIPAADSAYLLLFKYFSNGTMAWKIYRAPEMGLGVAVDNAGFVYVSGLTYALKVSSNGTTVWEKDIYDHCGNFFYAHGVAVDNSGYIYYGGYTHTSWNDLGLGLVKLFSNGTKVWDTIWVAPNSSIFGNGLTIDGKGAIYCVGYIEYYPGLLDNLALFKFFSNGTRAWQAIWKDSKESCGFGVVADSQEALYCLGCKSDVDVWSVEDAYGDLLLLKYTETYPSLPWMTILEPSNGAYLTGGKIWINGTAFAGQSHVFQKLLINDTRFTNATHLIGENLGTFGFYNTSYLPDGILRINVTGINEIGRKGVGLVLFTVDNTPPSMASISAPIGGSWVKGTIWINATAADTTSGIKNITFYRDADVLVGTSLTAPFKVSWNTSEVDGAHTLYVRAFDRAGNYLDSAPIAVTVNNIVTRITNPTAGAFVKGTIWINATAADAIAGIKNVTFFRDRGTLIGNDTTAPYSMLWDTSATSEGPHTLHARAFDNAGNYLDSATVDIIVDKTPPSVATITSPTENANIKGTMSITANATDAFGVKNVTFYLDAIGGTVIGTDFTSPYTYNWNTGGTTDGTHTLGIRVWDNTNHYLDSVLVTVIVDNTNPSIGVITSPNDGTYARGTISIAANGADATTGVKTITFWMDGIGTGTNLGTDPSAPYSISWNTALYSNGSHSLQVRVFDFVDNYLDSGAITVTVDNTAPTLAQITFPASGTNVSGSLTITTNVNDGVGVKNVTFWRDGIYTGTLLGTDLISPYTYNWNTGGTPDGTHTLGIRVWDNTNHYLDSFLVAVVVDNTNPSMAIVTSPGTGTYVKGSIPITVNVADATTGVKTVTFWMDGIGTGTNLGVDEVAPYSISWNTALFSDGGHSLGVRVSDFTNHYLDSDLIIVTIDKTPPSLAQIASPSPGANVIGTIPIFANGADGVSVKRMTFWMDGIGTGTNLGTDTIAPYSVSWNTTLYSDGTHTLGVRVFDFANNYLDSAIVTVVVDNTKPSTATITAPTPGTYLSKTVVINANAADAIGVANVTFYRDAAVFIGLDVTAPYTMPWNTVGLDGAHTLYVRVADRAGNYLDSPSLAIIVDNIPPNTVQITNPIAGAHINGTICIKVTATDTIGIKNVTFYRDAGILLGTATMAPYGVQWQASGYGVHNLYVRAFDNAGNYWDSTYVNVTVNTISTVPQNLQVNLRNGQVFLTWQEPASDGGLAITHYKIFRGTSSGSEMHLVTIANISSFTDTNLVNGQTYYYRISAINAIGESLWSAEVFVTVIISDNSNQTFILIIILLFGAVIGVSGYILHFDRKTRRIQSQIKGLSHIPFPKSSKLHSIESSKESDRIKQPPLLDDKWNNMIVSLEKEFSSALPNEIEIVEPLSENLDKLMRSLQKDIASALQKGISVEEPPILKVS